MESKQGPTLKLIVELISRLCLQLSSAQHERFEQAQEVLQTPTHTPAERRQKVKLVLYLHQRIKQNQDLLRCLGRYVEVATATADETTYVVIDDEDTVAILGGRRLDVGATADTVIDTTDDSMDVPNQTATTFIKEFGLGIDDVLAILSNGPAFWTHSQSSDVVAREETQHCSDMMYWPIEWKEEDPSQLGWFIDVSKYDMKDNNYRAIIVTTAELADNDLINLESCAAARTAKGVSAAADENDEVEVPTSAVSVDIGAISGTVSSLLMKDNYSCINTADEQTEILTENLYASVDTSLAVASTCGTTWVQHGLKSWARILLKTL